ncbi:BMP family ABC transporter substrate-binding protein [Ruminococcaceae bacterium OttesenSCG-928-A16]|nr:BMP family ABC transporter substrate-binding protein [Ruminococcaceae bacterium OttesenSCG-928-A16]
MKMKKLFAGLLSAMLLTSVLAACGGGAASTPASQGGTSAPAGSTASAPAGEDGMRIAIVTSPSGVDDGSFNQDNYIGIQSFIAENPTATVQAIRETDTNNSVPAVENIVSDYDVIVTPGFQFAGIAQVASDNPEKSFVLVDSFPSDGENDIVVDNIYAILFAEQESGFFAGVAAALETKTNKVAVVNGIAYPSNVNYQFGFESGVNYANAHLGTSAEVVEIAAYAGTDVTGTNVGGNYVGDFADEAGGKVVGEALLKEGCDIILVAAGGSGNGVFTAVKENGNAMVIGCDVDQFDDGVNGDKNIMLTSVLKVMNINVERALNAVKDGTFKGENVVLGADTDSTGYVKEDGRHQLSDETLAELEKVYALVQDGTIVPASNFNGNTPEDFPGLK